MLRALAGEHRSPSRLQLRLPEDRLQLAEVLQFGRLPTTYRTQAVLNTHPGPQSSQISPVRLRGSKSLQILTFNLSMYFRKLKTKALAGNNSTFVYGGGPPIVKTSPAVLPDGVCVNVDKLPSIKLGFVVFFFLLFTIYIAQYLWIPSK